MNNLNNRYGICVLLDCSEISKFRITRQEENNRAYISFYKVIDAGMFELTSATVNLSDANYLGNEIAVILNNVLNRKSKQYLVCYTSPEDNKTHACLLSDYVTKIVLD
jgi:hypothetical protein